ncbi:MAG: hypothetical protein GW779_04190 [Candidatus Altiarchaeum hamiconexum]|uniref:Uncharacterized protein n=1 Tax=Candidatus Altarchaeum hamiconexum TaxID=1803513 RepID=A0A8J8CH65_9ARCH|nr:hypothetical protein [Candidatus Altarchaeum hamiconexum]OIQ05427.1 MAG: hypothetical protein AUK59_03930 [Candidatus Altarchaeum sp. CG2_30_32_3053]PIN67695.1 MAG: hypothetical protein COV98_01945 [Candidatus Altarchaeum sp. CG12_big_fil_rev_8_21_14_0_65_33_22]PIV28467.1 MAG: hypothetical protein COS36_02030 [Candidatus Altarchaeum sp. CG03_land_8_20_14_0_80_32_618]PIZ32535.1 MAG: hypothetical protein COY41_01000 [Candidatus Altarchaeum sp. CG_4_10_14_0_8_um_filter_32_851]PJC13459.1 MAG: h
MLKIKKESWTYLIDLYNIQIKKGEYSEGLTVNLFKRITKKENISNNDIQQKFYKYEHRGYIARIERAHFIITDKGKKMAEEILKAQTKLIDYKK